MGGACVGVGVACVPVGVSVCVGVAVGVDGAGAVAVLASPLLKLSPVLRLPGVGLRDSELLPAASSEL